MSEERRSELGFGEVEWRALLEFCERQGRRARSVARGFDLWSTGRGSGEERLRRPPIARRVKLLPGRWIPKTLSSGSAGVSCECVIVCSLDSYASLRRSLALEKHNAQTGARAMRTLLHSWQASFGLANLPTIPQSCTHSQCPCVPLPGPAQTVPAALASAGGISLATSAFRSRFPSVGLRPQTSQFVLQTTAARATRTKDPELRCEPSESASTASQVNPRT